MKTIDIVAVAVKIISVFLIYKFLNSVPDIFESIGNWLDTNPILLVGHKNPLMMLPVYISQFIILVIALCFPVGVARFFLSKKQLNTTIEIDVVEKLEVAGSVIVGIYMLSQAVPDLVFDLARVLQWPDDQINNDVVVSKYKMYLLMTVVQILIGITLTFGSKGLVKLINSARN